MPRPAPFHVFTPQRDQPEELEKILVKRHDLIASAVEKMRESIITPDKHRLLFIGPRGMGKSYLVSLIHHRLSKQDDIKDKMRFAWLNEDQTSTTFLHLLSRIYRKASDDYPDEFPANFLESIRGKDPADMRELLGTKLIHHLADRTMVIFIENIDAIFGAMNDIEQRTWRGFIQDFPRFALIATAQGLTNDISSKDKPFFGFFDVRHLEPLTVDEAAELLKKIATLNNDNSLAEFIASTSGKARMRAIHHLSGGNPRLYLILSDFLTKDSLDNLVRLFEETVDRQLTPYFQERMRWISPQQQEIVQFLCQRVHPASVKDISEGIFSKQNIISSQLKQLRVKGYLARKSRGKESLYELAEPLMRLSFQVKEMNNRQPLALIVDFMRVWYDRKALEQRLAGISPGTWGRDYFEVALRKIDTEGNTFRHELMLECIKDIDWKNCDSHQLQDLRGIAEETNNPEAWRSYGMASGKAGDLNESIRAMTHLLSLPDLADSYSIIALAGRSVSYLRKHDYDKSIEDSSTALASPKIPPNLRRTLLVCRSKAAKSKGDFDSAINDLSTVIEDNQSDSDMLQHTLFERAELLSLTGKQEEAISDYGRLTSIPGISNEALGNALIKRGQLFILTDQCEAALADSERALSMERHPNIDFTQALFNRGICHLRNRNTIESRDDFNQIINSPETPKEILSMALYFRGVCYLENQDYHEAARDFSSSINNDNDIAPRVLLDLADVYIKIHQPDKALDTCIRIFNYKETLPLLSKELNLELGPLLIEAALKLGDQERWIETIKSIIPLIIELRFSSGLSAALVSSLGNLLERDLSPRILDKWISAWETITDNIPEMQVALRMLRTGIEWIKTRTDEVLLDLMKEERAIVRQALGLPKEGEDQ